MLASYDAFISYSRDDQAKVRQLVEPLHSRGYRLFFDQESIRLGENWKQRLDTAIRKSRTMVLCWSESAKGSEFVQFEYMRALALKKPVFPWLLDDTALPAMIEIQAITVREAGEAAELIGAELGASVSRRRAVQSAMVGGALIAGGAAVFLWPEPPPPTYEFQGEVTDASNVPLPGVVISATDQQTISGEDGRFRLTIAGERPSFVEVRFQKTGYQPEVVNAATGSIFRFALRPTE